ncbi:radical SAM protein [Desulfobacterium sp. N47]|uniref:radical SAM protein n=1 Tax=Desulfobacterium sp. N47 TaxID=3115210 RepID=UPI003F4A79D2
MKILFVQVPTSHLGAKERVYPLGISRLAALVPSGFDKSALDMNLYADPWPELKEKLEKIQPDIVALSFRNIDPLAGQQTSYLSSLKTSAILARLIVPGAVIIAGGPAFTLFAKRLMEEIPEIDFGLCGEGELSFAKILSGFPDIQSVPGIVRRNGIEIIQNPNGPFISMDEIPHIDAKSFCPNDYTKGNLYVAAMGIEGKRGCDLKCGYCLYPRLGGVRMRLRSPDIIADEMERLNKEFGINLFHFTDPVLNRPADHFEAICKEVIKRNLDASWTGFFREDTFTEYNADLAQKAGLVACYFSADALTSHGLTLLGKALTKDDILRASKITVKYNILAMCHFLVNLPFETKEHIEEAEEMMDEILDIHAGCENLGAVILNTIRLYPGARLTNKLIESGLLDPDIDLLYPVYHNPQNTSYVLHELEAKCHEAGVLSRLKIDKKKVLF